MSGEGLTLRPLDNEEVPTEETLDTNGPGVLIDSLARLPEKTILDEHRLASLLGVTGRTVRRMVQRHELPPPISFGGRSCWFAGRVLAHLDAQFERAEREAERHAAKLRTLTN